MKMIKIFVALFAVSVMFACGGEDGTNETTENTEAVEEVSEVLSIMELMELAYDDKGLDENLTVKGWFCGMVGKIGSDNKTLFLDIEQNNSFAALEIELNPEAEEALKDATSDNEITVTAKMVEYTGFGTHIKATDCKVISID